MKRRAVLLLSSIALAALLLGANLASAQDLILLRNRANSDDAQSAAEAGFHAEARSAVIRHLLPNSPFGIGGRTLRVKRNPAGPGCFVYEPNTRFNGTERRFVWWVSDSGTAFAVNGPAKMLTPDVGFARGEHIQRADQIVGYVFDSAPLPALEKPVAPTGGGFTVRDYHAYGIIIDTPMSVPETQARRNAARCLRMTTDQVEAAADRVQRALFRNSWLGNASQEVRHASDWNGQPPRPDCSSKR